MRFSSEHFSGAILVVFDILKGALIVLVIATVVIAILGTPSIVSGQSMEPNFHSGELVLVERLSYLNNKPINRGDVVAARFPADSTHTKLIKRVLGVPGDTISANNGQIIVNGKLVNELYNVNLGAPPYDEQGPITLQSDQYFLVGDNRPNSSDSRLWGPVQREDILGKVSFILFPFSQTSYVGSGQYQLSGQ